MGADVLLSFGGRQRKHLTSMDVHRRNRWQRQGNAHSGLLHAVVG